MTIAADTDWELRSTGATTNGGGFYDSNPGTSVDYSQQDAAQLSLSDIATDGAGTGVSSVTGGFTAAMEGNCMYISGSGFTTGWYQITAYTDTNNVTIDRSAGATQTGGTGNVGGAWLLNQTDATLFFGTTNKGTYNTCYWKLATYSGVITAAFQVAATYHRWEGYQTTRGDYPQLTNRPYLNFGNTAGAAQWTGAYGRVYNMMFNSDYTGSSAITFSGSGIFHVHRNTKVTRTGYNTYAMQWGYDWGQAFACEFVSSSGTALQYYDEGFKMSFCYIHDSIGGVARFSSGAKGSVFDNCIFDTLTGVAMSMYYANKVMNCTFYNCLTGVLCSSFYSSVTNSIFHSCTTAINTTKDNLSDNNYFYNNTADFVGGVIAGPFDALATDPKLVDPANQDFTLDAGSPCFDTGIKLGTMVGLP